MFEAMVAGLSAARVCVLGDVMLDHYVEGAVGVVSDEAPVPILRVASERYVPGGAANVAANIAALGGAVTLIGVIGEDAAGATIIRLLGELAGPVDPAILVDPARPTTLKTRYIGRRQQIVRVDRETSAPLAPAFEARLAARVKEAAQACDVLVVSDYGKGVLSDGVLAAAFDAAKRAGARVLVDPKRTRFSEYRGASIITPNRKELAAATGLACESDAEAEAAAQAAIAASGADILLTRSEKGMSYFSAGRAPLHLQARALEVFDVSGAGDTVVAVLALALGAGHAPEQAMALANTAAGVVVAKQGTATLTPGELQGALAREAGEPQTRAFTRRPAASLEEAVALAGEWRRKGFSIGFTNGCFDILHPGHVSLLAQAGAACDRLIVALNSDASVARLKGPARPVNDIEARAAVIGALRGVDLVIVFEEDTPLKAIAALEPDVLIKGGDYREDQVVGADLVKARGGRVLLAELVEGRSTTAIVAQLSRGG